MAWRPLTLVALLVLAAPTLGATVGPLVGAPSNVIVITEDTTWTGDLVLRDPVVVRPGAHLIIRDAHVSLDQPQWCPTRGSAGYCQPAIFVTEARLTIERSTLDTHGYVASDPESGWTIAGIASVYDIRDNSLRGMEMIGMQSPGAEPSTFARNAITESRGPVSFIRGASALIEDNMLSGMWIGIQIYDSPSTIRGNVLRDFSQDFGAGPVGRGIDVQATLVGEKFIDSAVTVSGNFIEGMASQGILALTNAPLLIADNVVRSSRVGVTMGLVVGDDTLRRESPELRGNSLVDNTWGVQFYTSGITRKPDHVETHTVLMRGNTFQNLCHDLTTERIAVHVDLVVDARENWWGSADGPQDHGFGCEALTGTATYLVSPWLTAAP